MSKYNALWKFVQENCKPRLTMTFDEIEKIAGVQLDHSFLSFKKELSEYGCETEKISMKKKGILYQKQGGLTHGS